MTTIEVDYISPSPDTYRGIMVQSKSQPEMLWVFDANGFGEDFASARDLASEFSEPIYYGYSIQQFLKDSQAGMNLTELLTN